MNTKDLQKFARATVYKICQGRPELISIKEDLEQEATLALLEALPRYDSTKGDLELYLDYRVRFAVLDYWKMQKKHYLNPPVDHESPYWDISDPVDVEELPSDDTRSKASRDLMEAIIGVDLTDRQQEFLNHWLDSGQLSIVADRMGIAVPTAHGIYAAIIKKVQDANDVP